MIWLSLNSMLVICARSPGRAAGPRFMDHVIKVRSSGLTAPLWMVMPFSPCGNGFFTNTFSALRVRTMLKRVSIVIGAEELGAGGFTLPSARSQGEATRKKE